VDVLAIDGGDAHAADEVAPGARHVDLRLAQGGDAVAHHAQPVAIDVGLGQALGVVLARDDLVQAVLDEIIGKALDQVLVEHVGDLVVQPANRRLERKESRVARHGRDNGNDSVSHGGPTRRRARGWSGSPAPSPASGSATSGFPATTATPWRCAADDPGW